MNKTFRKLGGAILCLAALSMTSCDVIGVPDNASGKYVVKINTEDMVLAPGETASRPSTNATATTTYTSSDPAVATVDNAGRVKAVAEGTCVITVSTPFLATKTIEGDEILSTATAEYKVIVAKKAGSISFAEAAINKEPGDAAFTNKLTVVGDGKVTFESSDANVATVDAEGKVTIKGEGTATITATVTDGTVYSYATKTASYTLTVAKPAPAIPLTVEAITAGTIIVLSPKAGMQYSLNGGDKTTMTANPTTIDVVVGDKVAFYGNGTSITSYNGTTIAGGTADVKVYGNIMSLVDETGFATNITLTAGSAFSSLFYNNAKLTDASGLLLPAITLTDYCYSGMFDGCTSLTTAPVLPATELAEGCYFGMFSGCTSLTTAPELPAETLAAGCYLSMFNGCISLGTAPALPAETLAVSCYQNMFNGCISLTTAPALPAETLAESCYQNMFNGCTSLTTAPALPATTLAEYCYNVMFQGCSSLTTAYVKAAYTIANHECDNMFDGCTATGAVLHTTDATSWTGNMGGANWTAVADWTD